MFSNMLLQPQKCLPYRLLLKSREKWRVVIFETFYLKCVLFGSGFCFFLCNTLIFYFILRKSQGKAQCWGVPLLKVQHFDINEWDVKEGEQPND